MSTLTLDTLNAADQARFTALLDGTYEHSPWVAERCLGASARSRRWPSSSWRWCKACATPAATSSWR